VGETALDPRFRYPIKNIRWAEAIEEVPFSLSPSLFLRQEGSIYRNFIIYRNFTKRPKEFPREAIEGQNQPGRALAGRSKEFQEK
jgi:hypothetical protein